MITRHFRNQSYNSPPYDTVHFTASLALQAIIICIFHINTVRPTLLFYGHWTMTKLSRQRLLASSCLPMTLIQTPSKWMHWATLRRHSDLFWSATSDSFQVIPILSKSLLTVLLQFVCGRPGSLLKPGTSPSRYALVIHSYHMSKLRSLKIKSKDVSRWRLKSRELCIRHLRWNWI